MYGYAPICSHSDTRAHDCPKSKAAVSFRTRRPIGRLSTSQGETREGGQALSMIREAIKVYIKSLVSASGLDRANSLKLL